MLSFRSKMKIRHFLVARHYGGHGIHSPFLYGFLHDLYTRPKRGGLESVIEERTAKGEFATSVEVESFSDFENATHEVVVWKNPFQNAQEKEAWEIWRTQNKLLSIWLPNEIVIFRNPKLPNQHFAIRN